MRKLLSACLMTLRWLLVLLLPVLGLVAGSWLIPEAKPKWECTIEQPARCVGISDIDGQPRLVINDRRTLEGPFDIIGLDLTTGKKVDSWKGGSSSQDHMYLLPGTTFGSYEDNKSDTPTITLTNWKQPTEVYCGLKNKDYLLMNRFAFQNKVLLADVSAVNQLNAVAIWRFRGYELTEPVLLELAGMVLCASIEMSVNGDWAIVCYSVVRSAVPFEYESHVALIDTRQAKIVQQLPSDIVIVRWLPQQDAFMEFHRHDKTKVQSLQRYERINDSFAAVGSAIAVEPQYTVVSPVAGRHLMLGSSTLFDPLRIRLIKLLGKEMESVVERLWPETSNIELYRADTGQMLQSLTLPLTLNYEAQRIAFHPEPNEKGFVLQYGQQISYWEFSSATRWYPRLGLTLGIALAILLAWLNLRRWKRVRA